ncbi:archaetidylserine synthase [Methanobrevibacter olleyae]|uniref:Archaetidylserine synthase n=1 Tax=Methanobrevibacter olleyae TaxID=294671 RepID=A0A126R1L1_METOL|nr:archaetidylserine synthase [Methanobrevibacter olleyae]AMK15849.1 archaetidylserine synthase [Methanobrevibacter olleyae]SFL20557.1 CDP-diacylglycerol---serine O-phosphatidyltransferase [Methanobrevibacter olleyae]
MRLKSVGMGYFLAIPDIISILNLVFGFLAILMVMDNHLTYASVCVLIAVVFDSVDGWVSRKLNRNDQLGFGKNIDSLADIVSFGVAPSVILYYIGLGISDWAAYLVAIVAIFTLICGILRLTRYNIISDRINYPGFVGFPIPATAIILVSYYLSGLFNIIVATILMLFAGYLMISTIRYPKVDNYYLIGFSALMIILLILPIDIFIGAVNLPALILFVLSLIYMFMTFLEFFIDTEEALTVENVNRNIVQAREITTNKFGLSLTSAQEAFKSMKDTINQVSSGEIVGENKEYSEEKNKIDEEDKLENISTGEVENE